MGIKFLFGMMKKFWQWPHNIVNVLNATEMHN